MRIAFAFAGQPRFFEKCFYMNQDNLWKGRKPEVFLHAWHNSENEGQPYSASINNPGSVIQKYADEKLLDLYKPMRYSIQRQVDFDISGYDTTGDNASEKHMFANFSWPYAIRQVGNLVERYENACNFRYDRIVVMRYDLQFHERLPIEELDDPNCLYTLPVEYWAEGMPVLCDQLFIGNSKIIRQMPFGLYDAQLHYHKTVGRINTERNSYAYCEDNSISMCRLPTKYRIYKGI